MEERSAAAEELLASLGDSKEDSDPEWTAAWAAEIERRVRENAPGIPAEEVLAEGRARLKRHQ